MVMAAVVDMLIRLSVSGAGGVAGLGRSHCRDITVNRFQDIRSARPAKCQNGELVTL